MTIKRGPGRPPLAPEDRPTMFAIRLKPDAAALLRQLSDRYGQSYPTVITAALRDLERKISEIDRTAGIDDTL